MSTEYACGLLVGLPFEELVKASDKEMVETMIHDGELEGGSIYYDSSPEDNVIGFYIYPPNMCKELNPDEIVSRFEKLSKIFFAKFEVKPRLYNTVVIY